MCAIGDAEKPKISKEEYPVARKQHICCECLSIINKKEKYQVKVDDTYYAIEYKVYPIWDSIDIILTSKNSFL